MPVRVLLSAYSLCLMRLHAVVFIQRDRQRWFVRLHLVSAVKPILTKSRVDFVQRWVLVFSRMIQWWSLNQKVGVTAAWELPFTDCHS